MTPAVLLLKRMNITHETHAYAHDHAQRSYGLEAAEKLGVKAERVFKTLVVELDRKELAVAILPVTATLSMKLVARSAGARKAKLADRAQVERTTGYVIGGVSPLGQKKRLRTLIDVTAQDWPTICVSAGRRGLEIELSPAELARLLAGRFERLTEEAAPGDR
jgi:Cys-tRNA(Pro)/Cys-tRNA(Cys) deacylase